MRANTDNFSLSSELDDESHTELADVIEQTTIPSAEDEMQVQSRREELLAHISELSPKERLVLTLRHGVSDNIPKSIGDVANFLNRPADNVTGIVLAGTQKICAKLEISESELAVLLLNTNPNPDSWAIFWKLGDLTPGMSRQIDGQRRDVVRQVSGEGGQVAVGPHVLVVHRS